MNAAQKKDSPPIVDLKKLLQLFDLKSDTDEVGTLEFIRANVDFRSANAWTLAFAILIASIGLNTNSTAVIIGAMLISPLMGPIVGAGLGLGINDSGLVKRSLNNLFFAVLISVLASFIYFSLSPFTEAQSELLARTRPTVFDALIAIFGGAAGIVALSRKEKSNAIPGVAIATALMPPLCTAGYALSQGKFLFFLGAFYLFLINSVYICLATFIFVRYLGFQKVAIQDFRERQRVRKWILGTSILVIIPGIFSAWWIFQEESFRKRANDFVLKEFQQQDSFVVEKEIVYHWQNPKIRIHLLGEALSEERRSLIRESLSRYGLSDGVLEIRQSPLAEKIEQRIKSGLISEADRSQQANLQNALLELQLGHYRQVIKLSDEVSSELRALFPDLEKVFVMGEPDSPPIILVLWKNGPQAKSKIRVNEFLKTRVKEPKSTILHSRWLPG